MKIFKFSLELRTRENTDVFITLDDNIYGIYCKRVNILYIPFLQSRYTMRSVLQRWHVVSKNSMYKFATIGETGIPTAVPKVCWYIVPRNEK